jgi:SAM-dependent methyltransferase
MSDGPYRKRAEELRCSRDVRANLPNGTAVSFSGWDASAEAWLNAVGQNGDYGRQFVLDAPMLARATGRGFRTALDIGCGEGRFCRMLQAAGIATVGIDPTIALVETARQRDPNGDYRVATAETLDVPAESFDLVVSYLTLVDIPELARATAKMVDAVRPGGTLLIANVASFMSAGMPNGWTTDGDGEARFSIDRYLEERVDWVSWRGIRVQNWHRPLSTYMKLFLAHGLTLQYFDEPEPVGGDPEQAARYRRVPFFVIMEWSKPELARGTRR